MTENSQVLLAYFIGAFLTLAEKARRYTYFGMKKGDTFLASLREWFLDPSVSNVSSWIATIGAVWVAGYLYVNQIPSLFGIAMPEIIVAASIGFLLGCLMETVAPNIIKLFTSKLPFGSKGDNKQ
jgi:hypothetical protein